MRPAVDVVIPFAGTDAAHRATLAAFERLAMRPDDTLVIADNRPGAWAGARPSSYFARNRGAARGANPWLVFLDADVIPDPHLLDRYFAAPVDERCAVLAGRMVDEPEATGVAARFASEVGLMSQDRTNERPDWAYAQTGNCAVRREAFDAIGGFTEDIRSGGDADLCFRLRGAGWTLERRDEAVVVHRSRTTLRALLRQRMRVGAGAGWLEERYPGFAPRRPLARAVLGGLRYSARGALAGGGEQAVQGLADAAFAIGTRLPNQVRDR